MQKEEGKERKQDEQNKAEKAKEAGKGPGKGRGTKKIKDECLPTPNARRVEPRVDPALRMKADKTARAKLKAQVLASTVLSVDWFTSSLEVNTCSTSETRIKHLWCFHTERHRERE